MSKPDPAHDIRLNRWLILLGAGAVIMLVLLNRNPPTFNHQPITSAKSLETIQRASIGYWLLLDCGFVCVYGTFLVLLCRKSASSAGDRLKAWRTACYGLITGSAVLDLTENAMQWASVSGGTRFHGLLVVLGCLKWIGPVTAVGYWFLTRPNRVLLARIALGLGCAAALLILMARFYCGHIDHFDGTAEPTELNLRQQLSSNLAFTVRHLSESNSPANPYGTYAHNLTNKEHWIASRLESFGYSPSRMAVGIDSNRYSFGGPIETTVFNIIAERKGTNQEEGIIVVGAHYDTMAYSKDWTGVDTNQFAPKRPGTPGANDNASGVAAMLEIARSLNSLVPKRTIRFVAFANEEPPFFQKQDAMGSWRYAQLCSNRHERILMMVSLDALAVYNPTNRHSSKRSGLKGAAASFWGLPDTANYVAFMSNWNVDSGLKAKEWAESFSTNSRVAVRTASLPFIGGEYFAWSDDWSFTRHGFPAFTATDTAFYRSPRYHEPEDTFENLTPQDFESYTDVVHGLSMMLRAMAIK